MATFTITIDTDNDTFKPNPVPEIVRILDKLTSEIKRNGCSFSVFKDIFDANSNHVGVWGLK